MLLDLKKKFTNNPNSKYEPWDFTFYESMYKKKVYNIEEDVIKEYFPSEHVKQGTLDIY